MNIILKINDKEFDPGTYISHIRSLVPIGRKTDKAYNCIAIDDDSVDIFQCQLSRAGDDWVLHNGQWRTECPKGILSERQRACSMCPGRCVNPRPAQPNYSWRYPSQPTLLNDIPLGEDSIPLRPGDVIKVGNISINIIAN